MTETNADNATEPEQDAEGLFASAPKGLPKRIRGKITAQWRADGALREPKTALNELGDKIE